MITPEVGKAYYVGNPEISSSLDILKVDAITASGDVIGREVNYWRPQLVKRGSIIAEFTPKKPSIWKRLLGEGVV